MRRLLDLVLICVYLAIAVLPVLAMKTRIPDRHVEGAFVAAPRPKLSLGGLRKERYQTQLVQWFERHLGLRGWSVWIDNTVLYHAFGETKWDSNVKVGRDGMLFERDDISYFNKSGAMLPGPRDFDRFAGDIARLQALLRARGKALVPLFVPSKTTIYPDQVSPLWTRELGDPRPSTERVYLAMKRALEAREVVFVDGIELLRASKAPRDVLWGRQARHFSGYAGCLCLREILARHAELTGTPQVDYPCVLRSRPGRDHPDLDLYRLLNAWGVPRDPLLHDADPGPLPRRPEPHAPRTLWISSSFGWVMVNDALQSQRLPKLHLAYYNSTLYEDGAAPRTFQAFDDAWNAVFPTPDLYVLELFETYLGPSNYFGVDAVHALLTAFGREPAPR